MKEKIIYISLNGECPELFEYYKKENNLEYVEQAGSGYLFTNGTENFVISSEVYWGKYKVWTLEDTGIDFSYKSYDNIPSMSNVATMEEADINSLLPGYRIEQLIEVWGEPETMNANEAIWRLSDDICLRVNFKNNGKIAICGLYELMGGE